MSRKGVAPFLITLGLLIFLVSWSGCSKLNVNYLKGNYHFNRANHHFTEGLYRKAIEEYELALQFNPNLVDAYRFLGESYKQIYKPGVDTEDNKQRAEKALAALQKAYEIDPNNKDVIYSLGDMYDKLGDFEEAEKLYLKILEMEPTNMANYYVVAEFYKRYAGEKEELKEKAEQMYLRRIELDPENPQGYAYLSQYYESLQPAPDFDKAFDAHDKRTLLEPDNAAAWLSKGVNRWSKAYRLQNQLSRQERLELAKVSEECLKKANELDPQYPEPYSWLSVLYKSVLAKVIPERAKRYEQEADMYAEKFKEARQRQAERKKLEEELKGIK